jgi:hypothetical protein
MDLGLHVSNFTWRGGSAQLRPTLVTLARTAESAGVARLTVMDHVWQIRMIGPPEHEMLEAYTTLGFLAAHTERVRLHTLVTGVVYRAGAAREEVSDARRAVGRARGARYRRGLERRGVARARAAVPADRRALRAARGDAPDLPADVDRRAMSPTTARTLPPGAHAELAAEP